MKTDFFGWFRRLIYLLFIFGLTFFIIRQGIEPWRIFVANWLAFLGVIIITGVGIVVQAKAFLTCLPEKSYCPSLKRVVHVWATSGLTSFLAPLVAGLAVRAVLLQREGVSLKNSSLATIRQTWFNCEYALVVSTIILILYPWPDIPWLGYGAGLIWSSVWLARTWLPHRGWSWIGKYFPSLPELSRSPRWPALIWLWGQVVTMAANYWVVYTIVGAPLTLRESLLMAAATILSSIAIFIPNGIGILDALWLWVATHHGLILKESTALVLTMRFGYLVSALLFWIWLNPKIITRVNSSKKK